MARPRLADKQANQIERTLYTNLEAAELIGISDRTLRDYKKLAWQYIPDFRAINFINGRLQRRKPLTPYQVWVLGKIAVLFSRFHRGSASVDVVRRWLKNNHHFMSNEAYRNELSQGLKTA